MDTYKRAGPYKIEVRHAYINVIITCALTIDLRRTSKVLGIVLYRCKFDQALYLGAELVFSFSLKITF